jgi:hypothetical protein
VENRPHDQLARLGVGGDSLERWPLVRLDKTLARAFEIVIVLFRGMQRQQNRLASRMGHNVSLTMRQSRHGA